MNKTFTQKSQINLDLNWDLTSDGDFGLVLTFSETRQREKTVKENGKKVKTGEYEPYIFEDKTYHPRVAQALRYYVEKSLIKCNTLEEIIQKEDKLLSIIEDLDKEFKQF